MSGKKIPLNEYITLQRGHDLPQKDRVDGSVPVVASTGIVGYHNQAKAKGPGVVIGRSGSIGGGQFITEDFWPLNTTLWVKDFKGHNERFVYFLLRNIDFSSFNVGSGVPTLNRNHLSSILVEDIGRDAEDKVAKILGDIDDKIQINNGLNQTLEQIAQAIFKSWFVDFDPVKAKIAVLEAGGTAEQAELAAMSAISAKDEPALKQLQAEQPETYAELAQTAALFPSKMLDSELGEIPEGWEVRDIDGVTSLIIDHRGKTPKKLGGDWVDEGYPALSAKNIKQGRIVSQENIRFLRKEIYTKWMREEVKKGDILLTSEAPMGEMLFLTNETKYCLSQRLYAIRANNKDLTPSYLYLWLQTPVAQSDLVGRATGTTVVGIRQSELRKVKVLSPGIKLSNSLEGLVFPLFKELQEHESQNLSLAELRDSLLPQLLSGELIGE